jgi:hypothetical protein
MPDLFKSMVWDAMVRLLLTRLFAAIPFLGFGPIGIVVGWIAGYLSSALYNVIKEFIDFGLIAFKNAEHKRAFDDASVKLGLIARDKGINSPEFKVARDAQKARLADFVRFAA